ncbi:MAG: isoleucine--tRNA ligase [Candidatus Pacebacteria bacterium]|nr:isoleucine--tRNA ligase [Candidatus Paceibacterota bacterium]
MPKVTNFRQPPDLPKLEEQVLAFWQQNKTFEKSVRLRPKNNRYVFYDGPPFATGLPHYGHILASTTKDVFPRYHTMKGKRVERIWGWDCHGLPIENLIEKELHLETKKEIENYGVAKFNQACRSRVLTYADEWQQIIKRMGRWVDMEHDYKTMEPKYMESLWWVFKSLWERGLIYQDYKSMHICPRCSTPLSNFEVTQGYKEVTDLSVVVEFLLKNTKQKLGVTEKVFALAWTTTPWTLPGNTLLAVDPKLTYVLFKAQEKGKLYLVAKTRLTTIAGEEISIVQELKGQELIGLQYQPLFPYFADTNNAFQVMAADFVTTDEGTGIVHIAPAFGEDDYGLGKQAKADLVQHVTMDGQFIDQVKDFAGMLVKPKAAPTSTDKKLIAYLEKADRLWSQAKVTHSYPHCWRCDTPLLNYATKSWFVKVTAIKDQLLKNNQKINWVPDHLKNGRFGKWLTNARDWAISRNRFWGTPLPVWQSDDGDTICVGSVKELEELTGEKITDLHKEVVDQLVISKNGKKYHRIEEVLDCWYESGSMPYASVHYPFENKDQFEDNFPAEFISEGLDQTRGWFYTLHVLATALTATDDPAIKVGKSTSSFKNVIVNGVVLAEDGKKMSKRLQNYPDPMEVVAKYGVDSLRLYLMSSTVMKAENLNFSEKEVADLRRKVFVLWWNIVSFYQLFAQGEPNITQKPTQLDHVLDQWLMSKLQGLIREVTQEFDNYDVVKASRSLIEFVPTLSTWYVRLSRDRFRKGDQQASQLLGYTIYTLAQLFAPLCPFFTEVLYHSLVNEKGSIHLTDWPTADQDLMQPKLEATMSEIEKAVVELRAQRKEQGIKLRQPLAAAKVISPIAKPKKALLDLIKQEVNLKAVTWNKGDDLTVTLDTKLTPELEKEGQARELIRQIQNLRRKAKLQRDDQAKVQLPSWPKAWQQEIENYTNTQLVKGDQLKLVSTNQS